MTFSPRAIEAAARALFNFDGDGRPFDNISEEQKDYWLRAGNSALTAALAVDGVALQGWQPIESAPKDGTDIIVYRPKFDRDYIPQVGTDYWMTKGVLVPAWAKSRKDCQPTHWMPLPPPPAASDREERR